MHTEHAGGALGFVLPLVDGPVARELRAREIAQRDGATLGHVPGDGSAEPELDIVRMRAEDEQLHPIRLREFPSGNRCWYITIRRSKEGGVDVSWRDLGRAGGRWRCGAACGSWCAPGTPCEDDDRFRRGRSAHPREALPLLPQFDDADGPLRPEHARKRAPRRHAGRRHRPW